MTREPPELLTIAETHPFLGLTEDQLNSLFGQLHVLRLPNKYRLMALPFAEALRDALAGSPYKPLYTVRRHFIQTPAAHEAIQEGKDRYTKAIANHIEQLRVDERDEPLPVLSAESVRAILYLGKTSIIASWGQRNLMETFRHDETLYVAQAALENAVHWEYPEDYRQKSVATPEPTQ